MVNLEEVEKENISSSSSSSKNSCNEEKSFAPTETQNVTYYPFESMQDELLRKFQNAINQYNDCFQFLQQTLRESEIIREENIKLNNERFELSILLSEKERDLQLLSAFSALSLSDKEKAGLMEKHMQQPPPNSFHSSGNFRQEDCGETKTNTRNGVPKSISIRASGFLGLNHPSYTGPKGMKGLSYDPCPPHVLRLKQKEELEEEVEVEVYNQGMLKTELCNKWEETGACPYGDRCQFAHGIEELRPVIRHPRYKTQLCRMIATGHPCPYGHRCHFRHSLTILP